MTNFSLRGIALVTCMLAGSGAIADSGKSVRSFGALGTGQDDTVAFQKAIDATPPGQTLYVPAGTYVIKATLKVSKGISITGEGLGSQLFGDFDGSLIQLNSVKGGELKDLFLGSKASNPNTGLMELINTEKSQITNVTMLGGAAGLLLKGSGGNVFTDVRSGTNFQQTYKAGAFSTNQVWIHAIGSTSNTYVTPVLEGGGDGMVIEEPAGTCTRSSCSTPMMGFGVVAEGVTGTGITFSGVNTGGMLTGTYLEANKTQQMLIADSSNLTFSGLLSASYPANIPIAISGRSSNIKIEEGYIIALTVGLDPQKIQLENIVMPDMGQLTILNGASVTKLNVANDGT